MFIAGSEMQFAVASQFRVLPVFIAGPEMQACCCEQPACKVFALAVFGNWLAGFCWVVWLNVREILELRHVACKLIVLGRV